MDLPTRSLQLLIRRISGLARQFDGSPESLEAVHSAVESFDSSVLQSFLPGRFSRVVNNLLDKTFKDSSGIYYADVYKDDSLHVNAFGFSKSGLKIPLHDHPDQHAVMKVFQGSARIRSFSIVPDEEVDEDSDYLTAIYEGETVISSRSGSHTGVLEPKKGNIHEVTAMESHTYITDFFLPNVPDCNYYQVDEQEPLTVGQTVFLHRVLSPREFYCVPMEFPSFSRTDIVH